MIPQNIANMLNALRSISSSSVAGGWKRLGGLPNGKPER